MSSIATITLEARISNGALLRQMRPATQTTAAAATTYATNATAGHGTNTLKKLLSESPGNGSSRSPMRWMAKSVRQYAFITAGPTNSAVTPT